MSLPVDHFGTKKFLLIEDSEPMRNVIRGFLRRCGALTVDAAGTGEIGAKALADTRYDVVVCDYNLSDAAATARCCSKKRASRAGSRPAPSG